MTTTKPSPVIETIAAAMLESGIVLPRRAVDAAAAVEFKTIEHVTTITRAKKPWIQVTYVDGTGNKWPADTQVVAVADSLPVTYWRGKYTALRSKLDELAKQWHHTAVRMGHPEPTSAESPAIRDGRARQARICANTVTALIAAPGSVIR